MLPLYDRMYLVPLAAGVVVLLVLWLFVRGGGSGPHNRSADSD
jgi:hypothetical protein